MTASTSTATARPVAHLNARISAYLVDSVVLLAFILVFFVIGGAVLLFSSDLGRGDPPDSAYYASIAIFLGGSLLSWTAFNLALMRWRGQTTGMYVIGIRTVGEDGPLTPGRMLLRWFGLHPLLFHPFLLPIWAIFSLLVVSLTLSQVVLVVTLALVLLCLVSPAVSLLAMLLDAERRALHDRLAHTLVVHLEQP
ncbi:MAG: hypothetical protein A2148_09970 [Chloroflexi bacterium RBG_16_68_14]|nr:MAG: hypothetical protein A2148_09970 [Chloroflexi bacterium RBG_16_68_14]